MNLYQYLYIHGDKFSLYYAAPQMFHSWSSFKRYPFEKYNKISANESFYDRFFVGIFKPLLSADQSYITIVAFI